MERLLRRLTDEVAATETVRSGRSVVVVAL